MAREKRNRQTPVEAQDSLLTELLNILAIGNIEAIQQAWSWVLTKHRQPEIVHTLGLCLWEMREDLSTCLCAARALLHACTSITDERSNRGNHPCRTSSKPSMPFFKVTHPTRMHLLVHPASSKAPPARPHTSGHLPNQTPGCGRTSRLLLSSPRNSGLPLPPKEPLTFWVSLFPSLHPGREAFKLLSEIQFSYNGFFLSGFISHKDWRRGEKNTAANMF